MSAESTIATADHDAPRRISNEVFGTWLFVFAEIMFFAGLISGFAVLRGQVDSWPPPGQPRLPILITGINTIALLASGFTVWQVRREIATDNHVMARQWLVATLVLGVTFLAIQGYEWYRLISYGLTTATSLYGAIFYVLIGTHAIHVIGALVALGLVLRRLQRGGYTAENHEGLLAMRLFWLFVVAVWPVLYGLVYLNVLDYLD